MVINKEVQEVRPETLIKTEFITVTPALALRWMEDRVANNRPISPHVVQRYAEDMKNGDWKLSPQGISFNMQGRMIDGQHRMSAVIASGVSVLMLVIRNVPDEAMLGIDAGLMRRAHDIIRISQGIDTNINTVAMVRAMLGLPEGHRGTIFTNRQLGEAIVKYREGIEFTNHAFSTRKRAITRAPLTATVVRAYYHADLERLSEFCKAVVFGLIRDPEGDSAAVRLREYCLKPNEPKDISGRIALYRRAETACKFFLDRKEMKKLIPVTYELFPLPGEHEYHAPSFEQDTTTD